MKATFPSECHEKGIITERIIIEKQISLLLFSHFKNKWNGKWAEMWLWKINYLDHLSKNLFDFSQRKPVKYWEYYRCYVYSFFSLFIIYFWWGFCCTFLWVVIVEFLGLVVKGNNSFDLSKAIIPWLWGWFGQINCLLVWQWNKGQQQCLDFALFVFSSLVHLKYQWVGFLLIFDWIFGAGPEESAVF